MEKLVSGRVSECVSGWVREREREWEERKFVYPLALSAGCLYALTHA